MQRKTGARGLRSIVESALLDAMFEVPALKDVNRVILDADVIEGKGKVRYVQGERATQA